MKISKLIKKLNEAKETYGDLDVFTTSMCNSLENTEELNEVGRVELNTPKHSEKSKNGYALGSDALDSGKEILCVLRYK